MLRAVTLITVNLLDFFNASRSSKKCCDTLEQSKFEIYTVISKSIKYDSPNSQYLIIYYRAFILFSYAKKPYHQKIVFSY